MSYPIYHQTWDGSASSYADWNLSGSTSFSVAAAAITSAPNSVTLANPGSNAYVLTKMTPESSANGTLTAYFLCGAPWKEVGILARCQGQSVALADNDAYSILFRNNYGQVNSHLVLSGRTQLFDLEVQYSSDPSYVYMLELRLNGSSIKTRFYDKTNGKWHYDIGNGFTSVSLTPVDVNTVTDGVITAAGRIGILNRVQFASGALGYVDDVFWDPPVPTIDHATLSVGIGSTGQLTAGGFSDPLAGVTWSSSDTGIATVSSSGVVTPVARGTATITATGKTDPSQTATSILTVRMRSKARMEVELELQVH